MLREFETRTVEETALISEACRLFALLDDTKAMLEGYEISDLRRKQTRLLPFSTSILSWQIMPPGEESHEITSLPLASKTLDP